MLFQTHKGGGSLTFINVGFQSLNEMFTWVILDGVREQLIDAQLYESQSCLKSQWHNWLMKYW